MTTRQASIVLGCLLFPAAASGQWMQTVWDLTVSSRYNYVTGVYEPFTPFSGTLTITFPSTVSSVTDYGTTTVAMFGGLLDTSFSSPVTPLVGAAPYDWIPGYDSHTSQTYAGVEDYPSFFVEAFQSRSETYLVSPADDGWWSYDIHLNADTISPSRGGTGSADYAFTTESLLGYLSDFQSKGGVALFGEAYTLYDRNTETVLDGFWWEGTATLASVTFVPEPSVAALLGAAGVAGILLTASRRRRSSGAGSN